MVLRRLRRPGSQLRALVPGNFVAPAPRASKRRRGGNGKGMSNTPENPSSALSQSTPVGEACLAGNEKRLFRLFLFGHHDCILRNQRHGTTALTEAPNRRHWLHPSVPIAFSFREPRENFMVLAHVSLDRCTFYRCSLLSAVCGRTLFGHSAGPGHVFRD